jgi:hypothetical protein
VAIGIGEYTFQDAKSKADTDFRNSVYFKDLKKFIVDKNLVSEIENAPWTKKGKIQRLFQVLADEL